MDCGLIDTHALDPDREMRRLVSKEKLDWAILNDGEGKGYYQPSKEDYKEMRLAIKREEDRAKKIFLGIKQVKNLLDDYEHERLEHIK